MKNKKNKKEGLISKKEFLIIFLAILILSGISYWNFKKSEKALPFFEIEKKQMENLEIPDLPSFEAPSLTPSSYSQYLFPEIPDSIMPKTEPEYSKKKTFISPDGNLKIIYPSEWLEIKITDIQKKTVEGLQWDFLFFARKFGEEKFGLLNVFKIIVPAETEKEQLFEEIKKSFREQKIETEIIDSEIKGKEIFFEARYKSQSESIRRSKGKIFFLEPKKDKKEVFLVVITAWEIYWEKFNLQAEIKEIFSDLQVFE